MIVPEFRRFPNEGEIIGRLLAGYGSLEFDLAACVAMARDDLNMVIKAMFRARGETQRVQIGDAMGRSAYRTLGLESRFAEAIADMLFCLKIRNQYAHCQWHNDNTGRLSFVDMEEIAKPHRLITNLFGLTFHYVTLPLLSEQEVYFEYVKNCIVSLNFDGRKKAGKISNPGPPKPKKVTRPPLHIP